MLYEFYYYIASVRQPAIVSVYAETRHDALELAYQKVGFSVCDNRRCGHDFVLYNTENEIWFRYEDSRTEPYVRLRKLAVLRETPKGVWINDYSRERFVLKEANRRWAYPTIELAQASFKIRKERQLQHIIVYHDHVKLIVDALKEGTAFTKLMKHNNGVFNLDSLEGFDV